MIYLKIVIALLTPVILATIYWLSIKLNINALIMIGLIALLAVVTYGIVILGGGLSDSESTLLVISLILVIGWIIAVVSTVMSMFVLGYTLPNEGRDTPEWILSVYVISPACIIAIFSAFISRFIIGSQND